MLISFSFEMKVIMAKFMLYDTNEFVSPMSLIIFPVNFYIMRS
jgi:hypothetical protein